MRTEEFGDVDYAATSLEEWAAAAPEIDDLATSIAVALQATAILGDELATYRSRAATRIDYLACRGAPFHNDVRGAWSASLFWLLAIDVADVELVMPHALIRCPLAPGDLLVFDPTMAHGLCRPADDALVPEASFLRGQPDDRQLLLTGEVLLTDAQWAALGAPWLPVEEHERRDAIDLRRRSSTSTPAPSSTWASCGTA